MQQRSSKIALSNVHYACLAPLPRPMIDHIRAELVKKRKRTLKVADLPPFHEARRQAYQVLSTAARNGDLSTTWLSQALTELSPGQTAVQRSTLLLWRKAGILRYDEEGDHPGFHNSGALLVARQCLPMLRGWLPEEMDPTEPDWYAWMKFEPEGVPQMVAMPLPAKKPGEPDMVYLLSEEAADPSKKTSEVLLPMQVPKSALLYTGWHGIDQEKSWLKVEGGGIRFLGSMSGEQLIPWAKYAADLAARDGQFQPQLGDMVGLENEPDIFETTQQLVLKLLARSMLEEQKHTVLWHA